MGASFVVIWLADGWSADEPSGECFGRGYFPTIVRHQLRHHSWSRPSMTRAAAWLSIWDENVAREVIDRDSRILLQNGDPASLSLATRCTVAQARSGTNRRDRRSLRASSSAAAFVAFQRQIWLPVSAYCGRPTRRRRKCPPPVTSHHRIGPHRTGASAIADGSRVRLAHPSLYPDLPGVAALVAISGRHSS